MVDQMLTVENFEIHTVKKDVGDPPHVLLVTDVVHEETNVNWKQSLRFDRATAQQLINLLKFMADNEGFTWP